MKRFLAAMVMLLVSVSSFAGLSYQFRNVSESRGKTMSLAGNAEVDGSSFRINVESGNHPMFREGSAVISTDAGRTMTVMDLKEKTYYVIDSEQIFAALGAITSAMPVLLKISLDNQKVTVSEEGDGGTIEGYPTQKYKMLTSYDMNIRVIGFRNKNHIESTAEIWATPKLNPEIHVFLQDQGFKTGIEDFDSLIDKERGAIKGLPLKQVINTVTTGKGGKSETSTMTMNITAVKKVAAVPGSHFQVPSDFREVDTPVPGAQ
ncbi:MAG: hypothetical protein ABI718_08815 [Acidobacteriota bacterium]